MTRLILGVALMSFTAGEVNAGCLGVAERRAARVEKRILKTGVVTKVATSTVTTVKAKAVLPLGIFPCVNCK